MTSPPYEAKDIFSVFNFISERGVLSGLYLATIGSGLVLGNTQFDITTDHYIWIVGACISMGLIISNITFELLIPLYRWATSPIVLRSFLNIVQNENRDEITSYNQLRKYREYFLASDGPQHLKIRIEKDERLRQTLTYLSTSSLLAFGMVFAARQGFIINNAILYLELSVILYTFIASLLGLFARSSSLGRTIGLIYLYQNSISNSEYTEEDADQVKAMGV